MEPYLNQLHSLLFQDSGRAWIFASLIFWLGALLLQSVLTRPVRKFAKRISSKNTKAVHRFYLFRSISGWFFFAAAWGCFVLFWYGLYFPASGIPPLPWVYGVSSAVLFLISVIFHLAAFAASCLEQIKIIEDGQLSA